MKLLDTLRKRLNNERKIPMTRYQEEGYQTRAAAQRVRKLMADYDRLLGMERAA